MQYKPLNLGQGFPDDAAPEYVTKALADIANDENPLLHQYTRGFVCITLNVIAISQLTFLLVFLFLISGSHAFGTSYSHFILEAIAA